MDEKEWNEITELLKDKAPVPHRQAHSKAEYARRKIARKRRIRRQRIRLVATVVLVLALITICVVLLFKSCTKDNQIVGTWDYDTVTVYCFDKAGKGELILPNSNYAFTYKIKDDTLTIDFENENATDSIYIFSVVDDKLTLTAESSDAVYVLTKRTKP